MELCCSHDVSCFLDRFFKSLSFKISLSGLAGVGQAGGCHPKFAFWLTFLKNLSIMLFGVFLVFLFFRENMN